MMNSFGLIMLVGWPIWVVLACQFGHAGRIAVGSIVFAWMFLPNAGIQLPGVPDYTKLSAAALGALVGVLLCRPRLLLNFRPSVCDLPLAVFIVMRFVTSVSNGLGAYDGMSAAVELLIVWGIPWYLGRCLISDVGELYFALRALVIGGLVYVPFCLWEVRMSPNLNNYLYGFGGAGVEYSGALGVFGSRPRVFMGTALTVGMFMTGATLAAWWLTRAGILRRLWDLPANLLVAGLALTALACKNVGALFLLVVGWGLLRAMAIWPARAWLFLLLLVPVGYVGVRATETWDGRAAVRLAGMIHEKRAESLDFRFRNENMLIDHALQRASLGWGGFGRNRPRDPETGKLAVTDGLWIIILGEHGFAGLVPFMVLFAMPVLMIVHRVPPRALMHGGDALLGLVAVLIGIYMIDNLMNAMLNPIYVVLAGGATTVVLARKPGVVPARPRPVLAQRPAALSGAPPLVAPPAQRR